MYSSYESAFETNTTQTPPYILEYQKLVDTVQLSSSRLLGIPGSVDMNSFSEVLASVEEEDHERIIREVGAYFDDGIVNFVTAILSTRRHQEVVIVAEESAGLNGYLPWEVKLQERIDLLRSKGMLETTNLHIERSADHEATVTELTHQAQSLAA